jgi:hypothetical protein
MALTNGDDLVTPNGDVARLENLNRAYQTQRKQGGRHENDCERRNAVLKHDDLYPLLRLAAGAFARLVPRSQALLLPRGRLTS